MPEQTNPFRAGDKVVCISRFGSMLVEGHTYTVRAVDGPWIGVDEPTGTEPGGAHPSGCGWHSSRFRRVENDR